MRKVTLPEVELIYQLALDGFLYSAYLAQMSSGFIGARFGLNKKAQRHADEVIALLLAKKLIVVEQEFDHPAKTLYAALRVHEEVPRLRDFMEALGVEFDKPKENPWMKRVASLSIKCGR